VVDGHGQLCTIKPMKAKILAVDDERDMLELLQMNLSAQGYIVVTVETAEQAIESIGRDRPDLVLLDVMLQDSSGIDLAARLKNRPETSGIPVILLTAKDTEMDIVVGLKVGADDYITKPFSMQVLAARIEAVLRRGRADANSAGEVLTAGRAGQAGQVRIMPTARDVLVDDKGVDLTSGEFDILLALVQAGGNVLSREQLRNALGDEATGQLDRIVDVHVAAMRKKLGKARGIIKTVHGRGYRINLHN